LVGKSVRCERPFANFQSPLSEEGHARTHTFHLLFMCVVLFVVVESSVLFANRRPFAFFFFFFFVFRRWIFLCRAQNQIMSEQALKKAKNEYEKLEAEYEFVKSAVKTSYVASDHLPLSLSRCNRIILQAQFSMAHK
jgi:Ca2+/Na+ antiporter